MRFERVTILGVGLLGGSLARALKRAGVAGEVVGYGHREATLARALELGVIDRAESEICRAVAGADVVVIAVPLGRTDAALAAMRDCLDADTVVTDVGSTKVSVLEAARQRLGAKFPDFVGGHPIAGTEHSGVEASLAGLYDGHRVILTPHAATRPAAVAAVTALWQAAGAGEVVLFDARRHDEILAATSHLPHVAAYALVDCLTGVGLDDDLLENAAGGFADVTRIASSSPEMWRDVCLANRDALLAVLDAYRARLQSLAEALGAGDAEALRACFANAKQLRDRLLERRRDPA